MAFKDRFEKIVSYFDTDDISDVEAGADEELAPAKETAKPSTAPSPQAPLEKGRAESRPRPAASSASPASEVQRPAYSRPTANPRPERPTRPSQSSSQTELGKTVMTSQGQMRIVLKYPRVYEDAPVIVDLLINNECVLIDFEQMTDAQARRCLDFLDGASRVLYGSLRKVSSTMYLLAPANVTVDIEDLVPTRSYQDQSYNYDMRPR